MSSQIKPQKHVFSLITLICSLSLATICMYLVLTSILPSLYKYITAGVIAAVSLICLVIGIFAKRKGFQVFLSILLILTTTLLSAGFLLLRHVQNDIEAIFTNVPETRTRTTAIITRPGYYQDAGGPGPFEFIGILDDYVICDIQPVIDEINTFSTWSDPARYRSIHDVRERYSRRDRYGVYNYPNLLLPEEHVDLLSEVYFTDDLLSQSYRRYIYQETVSTMLPEKTDAPDITKQPFTIALALNDYQGLASDDNFIGRSEINIVLSVNPVAKKVHALLIPRDTYVSYQGKDGNMVKDRLCYASYHGITPWLSAIENLLDCKIDYYARINASSIASLIDALGGLEINNTYGFQTYRDIKTGEDTWENPAYYFDGGNITLTGQQMLVYIRETIHLSDPYYDQLNNIYSVINGLVNLDQDKISYKNYDAFAKRLNKAVGTNLDIKDLWKLLIQNIRTDYDNWSYDFTDMSISPVSYQTCYSPANYRMKVHIPEEDMLSMVKEKMNSVLNTSN